MRLHEDKDAFRALLSNIAMRTSIREDIIEKDYYLTMMLWELSGKQDVLPAYFKGGTALYKALGEMVRFSEDIDLTVEIRDCSTSQGKKRLELAANGYNALPRTKEKSRENNRRGSITSVYEYTPATAVDADDALQRFGYVKVEATSFTVSEPFEPLEIAPLLYDKATEEEKQILKEHYGVGAFCINTIRLERIFADKILAAEFYYQRREYLDVAKHIFDLSIMMQMPKIQRMLSNHDTFVQMLAYKRQEETERIGSDLAEKPFSEFLLFQEIGQNKRLQEHFEKMQRIYVFDEGNILPFATVVDRMNALNNVLLELDEQLEQCEKQDQGMDFIM